MTNQPLYRVGHPAYSGDNRAADNLTTGEAIQTLTGRGIDPAKIVPALWKADEGSLVSLENSRGAYVELARVRPAKS